MARYLFPPTSGLVGASSYRIDTASGSTSAATIDPPSTPGKTIVGAVVRTDVDGVLPGFGASVATLYAKRLTPAGTVTGSPVTLTGKLVGTAPGSNTAEGIAAAIAAERVSERSRQDGTYAGLPATADAVLYVTAGGSDSNNGRSWGGAFATVAAALTALPASGGTIEIGAGTFQLGSASTGLSLTGSKPVTLRGRGKLSTVLQYTGTGTGILVDGTGTDPNDWGSIESLMLFCSDQSATTGVKLVHVHRGFLRDVYLKGNVDFYLGRGLWCQSAYGNYLSDCVIANFDTGIDLDGANNDFSIEDVNIGAQAVCVRVKDSTQVRIRGGQHSGHGGSTIGHMVIATTASIYGFEQLDIHFESNGIDTVVGRAGDGSTQTVQQPLLAAGTYPAGMVLDNTYKPLVLGANIGDGVAAKSLTLTASCTYPVFVGLRLSPPATITDSSGGAVVVSDINGRTGIGTLSPGAQLHVSGGDVLLDNNRVIRFKDSGGSSRRIQLVSGGNAIYYGDVDNLMTASELLLFAKAFVKLHVDGTQYLLLRPNFVDVTSSDLRVTTAGKGVQVKEGSNAKMGTATLVGGTVAVSTTAVTASSRIFLTAQSVGGTAGALAVTARTAGTSFTITSTSGTDTSTVAWFIVEPA